MTQNQNIDLQPLPLPDINSGRGFLIVRVFTGSESIPLENADVTVSPSDNAEGNEKIEPIHLKTDSSGNTERIFLPTPTRSESLIPNSAHPYSSYNIEVKKTDYFTHLNINVSVFGNVTSIQPVEMIPLSLYRSEDNRPDEFLLTTYTKQTLKED